MASRKKPAKKVKDESFGIYLRNIPKNEEEHILHLIEATERCITKDGTSVDEFFTQQAARLKKELGVLRKKK